MKNALTTGTINTDIMVLPDYSGSSSMATIEPERMSPMDSLKAIFEDMRDSLNMLVELAKPSGADMRDQGISDADIPAIDETDSQGNDGFALPEFERPEIGPKVGLALMLVGLSALFRYGDEIAAALEPVLKFGKEFYDSLSPNGRIGVGMAGLAAIMFPKTLTKIVTTTLGLAFDGLKLGFKGMVTAVNKMPGLIKTAYTGGKNLVMGAFDKLKTGFQAMRTFMMTKMIPALASAYGGAKGFLMKAITSLGTAFTAMRTFMMATMIPAITGFMAPFIVPLALLTAAVVAAVAIFTSIKAGIDEFKKSLDEGDSMLVAIIEGVSTALLTLVTLPITLIKNFVAWVAKKLGFEGIAEKLKEFSIVDFIKDSVKNLVMKAVDFVQGLFDIDFKEVLGKFVDIGKSIGRVLKAIALGSIAAVKAAFPGGESPMEAFKRVYDEVANKNNDRPQLPDEADPEANAEVRLIEQGRREEIKDNEAKIEQLQKMDESEMLADGSTADDKIVALESRNADLLSLLYEEAMIQSDIARKAFELQEKQGGGTVVTTINNTDASNTSNTSNNVTSSIGLAVAGTDETAKSLAQLGYGPL